MRRFGRRYGEYPMLLIGPDEPLTLIAAAALGRWAYRHRSAFVPFAIMAAAFVAAGAIHHHHARYWILAAVLTFQARPFQDRLGDGIRVRDGVLRSDHERRVGG